MAATDVILPDLQSCVLCEDVRHEFNGMQTLVGVINIVPAPQLPITCMRLCIWSRWCSGAGRFKQRSRIVGVDEQQVLAQAEVDFELKEMEGHATNVHYFGGVQFQQFGLHHVEIYLQDELRLRFPLPVVRVVLANPSTDLHQRRIDHDFFGRNADDEKYTAQAEQGPRSRYAYAEGRYARQRSRIKIIRSNNPPPGK